MNLALAFLAGAIAGTAVVFVLVSLLRPDPPRGNGPISVPEPSDDL